MRRRVIGVMGGGESASPQAIEWAHQLGKLIAEQGLVVLTGGRSAGVMDGASRGAHSAGGLVVGVLPGATDDGASDALDVAIVTGMGSARNNINVLSSDVVIACGNATPGTLSEIALALKASKPVVVLSDDPQTLSFMETAGGALVRVASTPDEAVDAALAFLRD